jgi:hypothetical protein
MHGTNIVAVLAILVTMEGRDLCAQKLATKRDVNVRKAPSTASAVLTTADSGTVVELLSKRGHYDHVELADGKRGWIYERFLVVVEDTEDVVAATVAPAGGIVTTIAGIEALPKVDAQEANAPACRNEGAGNPPATGKPNRQIDSATNLLKNRIDDGQYVDVSIGAILKLPWANLPRQRFGFSSAQLATTSRYERAAIRLTGFIVKAVEEGKESTNCELDTSDWHDWHLWLVNTAAEVQAKDRTGAVVFEVTPRVRMARPALFDKQQVQAWARNQQKVQVSGWLMLDPEHPDQVGKSRGTTWEIHPTMKIQAVP